MSATTIAAFTQNRQNQTRRRATTSSSRSCWLSRPKRLGRGISRWKTTAMTPRKEAEAPPAARPARLRGPGAEEAGPGDQPMEDDVDDAAEADDEPERRDDRPEPRP